MDKRYCVHVLSALNVNFWKVEKGKETVLMSNVYNELEDCKREAKTFAEETGMAYCEN